jgi:hypothetical protein
MLACENVGVSFDASARTLNLVKEALDELDRPETRLSTVIRKAIRIARLRNDYENLFWLRMETIRITDQTALPDIAAETSAHVSAEEYKAFSGALAERYRITRQVDPTLFDSASKEESQLLFEPIESVEATRDTFKRMAHESTQLPEGMHPVDIYMKEQDREKARSIAMRAAAEYESVLARIATRVHDFLSRTEQQLIFGQANADIFERNRQYVERRLSEIAPQALEQFAAARRRAAEGDAESRSHALTSCRRILKEIADVVYPPRPDPVIGKDGKKRDLSEQKYIARLWQFVADNVGGHAAGDLVLAEVDSLGRRIDRLYALSSKGVHDQIEQHEVDLGIIQTYLVVGDVLRIAESSSALNPRFAGDKVEPDPPAEQETR